MKFVTILAGMLLVSQTEQAIISYADMPPALNGRATRLGNAARSMAVTTAGVASNVMTNANSVKSQILPSTISATTINFNGPNQSNSGSNGMQIDLNGMGKGLLL